MISRLRRKIKENIDLSVGLLGKDEWNSHAENIQMLVYDIELVSL